MIICALILLICVTSSKVLYKFGVPILLIFITLGMLTGSDGIVGIDFNNFNLAKELCSIGLVFIIFYGGFGTNWNMAKPIAIQATLLSTIGVAITAILTGLFCFLVFNITLLEGILIGSIVASTDAASVFAILRSQKLNLKGSIASILELESGSNDPFAYMFTIITIGLMSGGDYSTIIPTLLSQISIALAVAFIFSKLSVYILKHIDFEVEGFYPVFVTSVALLSYALSEYFGGNGYLCVYISGIIIGNSSIPYKNSTFHFFDGVSWIMQIILFFTLGLLSFPSEMVNVVPKGVAISLFLIFIARPVAVFSILHFFNASLKEKIFVSWVGLRGAASLVFAIYAITSGVNIENDIFHIVFFVALFSVTIQGTLIPKIARKLDLIDNETSVLKTFTDYKEDTRTSLVEVTILKSSSICNKAVVDSNIPEDILIVMIKRGSEVLIPNGSTMILPKDTLVIACNDRERLNSLSHYIS